MRAPETLDPPPATSPPADDHDELRSAREGLEEAMRRAGLEELIAEDDDPPSAALFDDRAGDITGEFDSLAEATTPPPPDDEDAQQPMWREEPDDDPFLAELRRAVGDTEPLGPRDPHDAPTGMDLGADDDPAGGFLRRRRRS
jgi:hypothetical protein